MPRGIKGSGRARPKVSTKSKSMFRDLSPEQRTVKVVPRHKLKELVRTSENFDAIGRKLVDLLME